MKHLVPSFAALAALATLSVGAPARAIELYATPVGGVVVLRPPALVYAPRPVVVYRPAPVSTVHVTTTTTVAPPADGGEPTHPQPEERSDPAASFFIGGGYGGMTAFQGGAASIYRLHVGLGLGATEFGLRADIADRALDAIATTPGGAWLVSAEVAHRFLPGSTVRPVLGVSFDRWQIEPDGREGASVFGLGARTGVEIHYRLNPGAALVFGADVGYHRMLATVDNAQVAPDVLTFGATADLRL